MSYDYNSSFTINKPNCNVKRIIKNKKLTLTEFREYLENKNNKEKVLSNNKEYSNILSFKINGRKINSCDFNISSYTTMFKGNRKLRLIKESKLNIPQNSENLDSYNKGLDIISDCAQEKIIENSYFNLSSNNTNRTCFNKNNKTKMINSFNKDKIKYIINQVKKDIDMDFVRENNRDTNSLDSLPNINTTNIYYSQTNLNQSKNHKRKSSTINMNNISEEDAILLKQYNRFIIENDYNDSYENSIKNTNTLLTSNEKANIKNKMIKTKDMIYYIENGKNNEDSNIYNTYYNPYHSLANLKLNSYIQNKLANKYNSNLISWNLKQINKSVQKEFKNNRMPVVKETQSNNFDTEIDSNKDNNSFIELNPTKNTNDIKDSSNSCKQELNKSITNPNINKPSTNKSDVIKINHTNKNNIKLSVSEMLNNFIFSNMTIQIKEVKCSTLRPSSRVLSSGVQYKNYYFLFGGLQDKRKSDVWVLCLDIHCKYKKSYSEITKSIIGDKKKDSLNCFNLSNNNDLKVCSNINIDVNNNESDYENELFEIDKRIEQIVIEDKQYKKIRFKSIDSLNINDDNTRNKYIDNISNYNLKQEMLNLLASKTYLNIENKNNTNYLLEPDYRGYKWFKINPVIGKYPDARSGHSTVLIDNKMFIYGGQVQDKVNDPVDVVIFDLKTLSFTIPDRCFNYKEVVRRHCHVAVSYKHWMLIQGGKKCRTYLKDEPDEFLSDAYLFNSISLSWEKLSYKGEKFQAVCSHSATLVMTNFKINSKYFDFYKSSSEANSLSNIPLSDNERIKIEGIYFFGGLDNENNCYSFIKVLKICKRPCELLTINAKGKPPRPRYNCSLLYVKSLNCLALHGGRNSEGLFFNDFFFFNLESHTWISVMYNSFQKELALRRAYHHMIHFNNDILIFGGENETRFESYDTLVFNVDYNSAKQGKKKNNVIKDKIIKGKFFNY